MSANWIDYRASIPSSNVICDLSAHINALTEFVDIADVLTPDQEKRLVDFVKTISNMSYNSISRRYPAWLEADRAHDVYVPAESTSFRTKAVIADTRAIADTVITYFMAAITGRNPMFQLEGLNRDSRKPAALLERVIHQQQRRTAGEAKLAQHFLDIVRYGFAPTKIIWSDQANTNIVVNADPRRTFPDPRVSFGDVEKMQYVVFSDHASAHALMRSGMYPKLAKYPRMLDNSSVTSAWDAHNWHKEEGKGWNVSPTDQQGDDAGYFRIGKSHIIDEAWVCFNGYDIGLPGLEQVWMVVTIIDERFVIRCQFSPYGREFPCTIGGFGFDYHKTHQQSLYDLLMPLHELGTWLMRSRIDNVQAALNNLIFADPTRVAIHDLINRNPWGVVRTLPGTKPGEGVHIASVPDVTRGHWQDIGMIADMKQRLSAASDAQQGMPTADGIRTATEIQRLSQMGSQRLGVLSRVISSTSIRPMIRMMAQNIQDALRFNASIKVGERESNSILQGLAKNGYVDVDVDMLQGQIEYLIVDGTLPIEPTRSPETWIQILQVVNQAGLAMEYDMGRMVEEAVRSMGVPDVDQFRVDQQRIQREGLAPHQQLAIMEKLRGQSSVMPQENVEKQLQAGNIVPLRSAA